MVQIVKIMQAKHLETLSSWQKDFCETACQVTLPLLPQHLATFPTRWPFPRGDLYHWIKLLNRFDGILDNFCKTYGLNEGPQTKDFGCILVEASLDASQGRTLEDLGYGTDGDRQMIESILAFSRVLLRNCGNRSLYASSAHMSSLLNSTSLSVLEITLSLAIELAQRYQAALKRMHHIAPKQTQSALASHYNINLDRVQQLAMPFTKTFISQPEPAQSTTPATPSIKGKEKAHFSLMNGMKASTTTVYATDLVSIIKGGSEAGNKISNGTTNGMKTSQAKKDAGWEGWGDVRVTYYPKPTTEAEPAADIPPRNATSASSVPPVTPTPSRRSNLGPHGSRSNRVSSSDESPHTPTYLSVEEPQSATKNIEISSVKLMSDGIHKSLTDNMAGLPQELQYELLTKLRVADALTTSLETRQQILAIRLLAIANLAYIHQEVAFLENVLKQDSEEPRRLQLAYQLAELVHPPAKGDVAVPQHLQTTAFVTLEALSQLQTKISDVCAALNTNVNHGVLLYVIRQAVAGMNAEDTGGVLSEDDEWRDALFSLIAYLSVSSRPGTDLVTAGLLPILVEILGLRNNIVERYHNKVLSFLDNIMYIVKDAFTALVEADGLDAISSLIVFEVASGAESVSRGSGIQPEQRSSVVDYQIPFFKQQTLKWLFKFIHHMMTTAGGYGGNFDRLLRNLIDSPQLLGALRQIIGNSQCFGSVVWTNAVNILNDFINNEPTSFAIIAEAGLSRGLLEAVTGRPIIMPSDQKKATEPVAETDAAAKSSSPDTPSDQQDDSEQEYGQPSERPSTSNLEVPREGPLARGIMPTSETISVVPQAFGSLCLNNAGMRMFQASGALESFFEIFESPEHVKCMDVNKELPSSLGSTFDELVRHHPPLKTAILNAVLNMVTRVSFLCKMKASKNKIGAKLWTVTSSGAVIADEDILCGTNKSSKGKEKAIDDNDAEMHDPSPTDSHLTNSRSSTDLLPNASMTPYIAAAGSFLHTVFNNSSLRSEFCSKRGIEHVLDLANSPCLAYDFGDGGASQNLRGVISMLVEQKPHLAMLSLMRRALEAADTILPLTQHDSTGGPFFKAFVNRDAQKSAQPEILAQGTKFVKALVNIQVLVSALQACFQNSSYHGRGNNSSLNALHLSDYYVRLVQSLGPLLGASFREGFDLDQCVPECYKGASRVKDSGFGELIPDIPSEVNSPPSAPVAAPATSSINVVQAPDPIESMSGNSSSPVHPAQSATGMKKSTVLTKSERESPEFKNFMTLKYLLSRMSRTISPFFQVLGRGLVSKRNTDAFQKQGHVHIADALAETILRELAPRGGESSLETNSHWIGTLQGLKDMLIDVSRQNDRPVQTNTLVLKAFKDRGGFDIVNRILQSFACDIQSSDLPVNSEERDRTTPEAMRLTVAVLGMRNILSLYSQIVTGKNICEAAQTASLRDNRDRDGSRSRSDVFNTQQFIVELRYAMLPVLRKLWESSLCEKAPSDILEKLIEVIRIIANADSESGSLRRADHPKPILKGPRQTFTISQQHLDSLSQFDNGLAREALYRCNNNLANASEYCLELAPEGRPRYPIPEVDISPEVSSRPRSEASAGTSTSDDPSIPASTEAELPVDLPAIVQSFSQQMQASTTAISSDVSLGRQNAENSKETEELQLQQVTVDDLNDERTLVRNSLAYKSLEVINVHGDVTFEVADLITTVVAKSPDPAAQRKDVGETLVTALMSFAVDEDDVDAKLDGKKVAAYAHLLALLLRDQNFYAACVDELKNSLDTLLNFVKLPADHSSDATSPWIPHILLIVEMLLSADARPVKTSWTPPKDETETVQDPVLDDVEPSIPPLQRSSLLEGILNMLPRIGKDESLALAVLRVLVILTRTRSVAQKMGLRKNLQRLFVMVKQVAAASSSRIHSPMMIILRHIIEDEDTIKQIMRTDIQTFFESQSSRTQRTIPLGVFLKNSDANVLRCPELFVQVANDMIKYSRWNYSPGAPPGSNHVVLKPVLAETTAPKPSDDGVQPTVQATEDLTLQDIKPSTEAVDTEMPDATKNNVSDHKLPVVDNPDGVIHYLLTELMAYKTVEDTASTTALPAEKPDVPASDDVAMGGTSSTSTAPTTDLASSLSFEAITKASKSTSKQDFKSEEHPIYIYRCFILQCLTELLCSYNRTKIEFINFKRSAPPQAMTTPSKPRSSVINYLLFDLIPSGNLDNSDSTVSRKKGTTSYWADAVITALLAKTSENSPDKSREQSDGNDEPDLVFVRRFVLENILKAYKEATASSESLDAKCGRMCSLAALMDHIMTGKDNNFEFEHPVSPSHHQLRRLMFEKGFIVALTASIADLDLNYPGAKRAVKQILRPLKVLTSTAVRLSELSLISTTPGQAEDDDIESATSVSDDDDDREETPDLFRNSTLGMFEPNGGEESSSESEDGDEEMEEYEYGDEMEYEEDEEQDAEDNISEEDEDIEGVGPIEGLSGDHGEDIEVDMEDDEDEESSDDDSHEHDSDDEDHGEVIDDGDDIQELGEQNEMDGWESDDGGDEDIEGEEEDYEGQALDLAEQLEEQAEMGMPGGLPFAGHLNELVRALGNGDGAEMLLRMDEEIEEAERDAAAEGDEDEHMGAEYDMDEDDDEEEDEDDDMGDDMEDEEQMFLEQGPPPGFRAGDGTIHFGFDDGGPGDPVIITHRGHRPRGGIAPPFALFGRSHDPLVGEYTVHPPLIPGEEVRESDPTSPLPTLVRPSRRDVEPGPGNPSVDSLRRAYTEQHEREMELSFQMRHQEGTRARRDGNDVPGVLLMAPSGRTLEYPQGYTQSGTMESLHFSSSFSTVSQPTRISTNHRVGASYRSHRNGQAPPRMADDGTNPLLRRQGPGHTSRDGSVRPLPGSILVGPSGIDLMDLARSGMPFGTTPTGFIDMIRHLPDMPGQNGRLQLHFPGHGPPHGLPADVQAMFGLSRGSRAEPPRRESNEPLSTNFFTPKRTYPRWKEEMNLIFGANVEAEVKKVKPALEAVLAPPAIEADKLEKAALAERARVKEEELKKKQEEERVAKEAQQAAEKLEKEKREAEDREAAERAAAETIALQSEQSPQNATEEGSTDAMEGVETDAPPPTAAGEGSNTPAEDRPRVTTMIRGQPYDITDLGIDADFLAELPEEIREEVIMSAVAERRSQAAATGAQPSEIDREFLDALPADIRQEIEQQERQERRRREREEQRRQQAALNGGGAAAAAGTDMDIAGILATLAPALRQQILLEQDEDTLATFPEEIAEQARAAQREHPHAGHHARPAGSLARNRPPFTAGDVVVAPPSAQRPPRRPTVQMLDKSGIATLLRLMFTFQNQSLRGALNSVLDSISLNRQNRNEVVSTLLHILQDGSVDMSAIERSFAHLSLKAKQPKEKDSKTPQALKRTFTGMSGSVSLTQTNPETSPLMVVNQCLLTLEHLTKNNPHIPAFFLTEQDAIGGLKRSLSRKGKGKDNKAAKFALNSLLSLLERHLIMENSSVMEILAGLLSLITIPLQNFQRKQKEAEDSKKKDAAAAITPSNPLPEPVTAPESEQSAEPEAHPTRIEIVQAETTSGTSQAPETAPETQAPSVAEVEPSTSEAPKPVDVERDIEKKQRSFGPPTIPDQNLKLVINIFVARECSSKTFRDTLSTIKNLSAIPGAKAVFGRELIAQAQRLGEVILKDLEDLFPQIQKAATGTEIQGVALAKFSPGGSDQNKLLRVLTALDHLFDPKREKKDQEGDPDHVTHAQGESTQAVSKQDLLASLYENSTFGPMWEKLSACLSAIRQREHMLNVATILLPLIEALMVVCKNTTSKDAPIAQTTKEMMLGSPPPESRMDSLFFTFTEEHRKILNDLVRHTPKLMSGTFSLLVKNPKVLEFDNKRNYFTRSIREKNVGSRQTYPTLQLSVRRDQVFHDSFKSLYFQTGDQMKYGKLSIRFHGEEGVDAGGVTREWFQVLARQMFDPGYALFVPVSSDRTTFHPNQLSGINEEHLMFFKFIGRIIGKALYDGRVLDCHFSRAVYKRILGKSVSLKDMESLDPDYYKSLIWMLENDITDIITETFSADSDKFGVVETVDFIPDGRNVPVTESNKHEYVRLMVEFKLTGSVKEQLDEFLKGFHEVIPAELVAIFNEQELELLISGLPEIDVDDWKSHTEYQNYSASSPQIQWFWRAVRSYDKEERAKLLQFVTGTSKVPLNGFKELEGMNGFSRFNIHRDYGSKDRLPSSHTCFNQLDLPEYESYESLRSHVLTAITAGSSYFGFA